MRLIYARPFELFVFERGQCILYLRPPGSPMLSTRELEVEAMRRVIESQPTVDPCLENLGIPLEEAYGSVKVEEDSVKLTCFQMMGRGDMMPVGDHINRDPDVVRKMAQDLKATDPETKEAVASWIRLKCKRMLYARHLVKTIMLP